LFVRCGSISALVAAMLQMNEFLFKIIVIGEANVGKTSTIKRYVSNEFSNKYKYTIGVDFALKHVDWDENTVVRLQLWDIAGQERFGLMTHVYYKEATAACIVFDVTAPRTFEAVTRWKSDLNAKVQLPNGEPVPCILLANKCDLKHDLNEQELNDYAKENGFIAWFPTSAKSNQNIERAMNFLIQHIIYTSNLGAEPPSTEDRGFRLTDEPKTRPKDGCCLGSSSNKQALPSKART